MFRITGDAQYRNPSFTAEYRAGAKQALMLSVRYRILWGEVRESNSLKKSVLYRRDVMPVIHDRKTATWAAVHAHV